MLTACLTGNIIWVKGSFRGLTILINCIKIWIIDTSKSCTCCFVYYLDKEIKHSKMKVSICYNQTLLSWNANKRLK